MDEESLSHTVHSSKVIFNPRTLHFTADVIVSLEFLGSANCFINFPHFVLCFLMKRCCPTLLSRPLHAEHLAGLTCAFTIQDAEQMKNVCVHHLILTCKQLWLPKSEWVAQNLTQGFRIGFTLRAHLTIRQAFVLGDRRRLAMKIRFVPPLNMQTHTPNLSFVILC